MKVPNKIYFIALLVCVSVSSASASAQSLSSTALAADSTFTQNLSFGMSGNDVSALQRFLIAGGFLKILAPTGYFGHLTRAALGAWQASVSISPPTGFFGPISRGRINAASEIILTNITPVQDTVGTTTTVKATGAVATTSVDGSPTRLTIPKLGVIASFQYNGLKSDGTMEIPTNVVDVGWYTGSPRPGEKGVSIITGHVSQIRKGVMTRQGVFYNLSQMRPGDKLYVLNDKGESVAFVVRESRLYDPLADATNVFTSTDDGIHLNIITCEGTWNQAELSYSKRLVVFTDAVQ